MIFYVCEADYRGQMYGSERCRRRGRRSANARHQASPEGRLDHRDAMRAHRSRSEAPTVPVTDNRSNNLAAEVSSCVRDDVAASAMGDHAFAAESMDDGTNHSDDAAPATRYATPGDGGETRADAGDPGTDDGGPPAGRGHAAGGATAAVAPADALCCVVCGRGGVFIRDAEARRARVRHKDGPLRRRGRVPRPPSARPKNPGLWQLR